MIPSFASPFGAEMEGFLAYKRSLGHPYRRGEQTLRSFDRYIETECRRKSSVTKSLPDLVFGWLSDARRWVTPRPVKIIVSP
jgi:hypothetical protein